MDLKRYRLPIPEELQTHILRLYELLFALDHPGGDKIPFGDTHRGESRIDHHAFWAAFVFLDARFKGKVNEESEVRMQRLAKILMPEDPQMWIERYQSLPAEPVLETTHILPEAGWAVIRTGWEEEANVLAVSWKGSERVAHSGYETLGFNLWVQGEPLLVKMLGESSYTRGYPEGYWKTPNLANLMIPLGAKLTRESGSLRNWHTSEDLDFLDMEHLGWDKGKYQARRRVLFIKPSWIVMIDEIHGDGEGKVQWQTHTGNFKPVVEQGRVRLEGEQGMAKLYFLDSQPEVEELLIEGMPEAKPRYLLKAVKGGQFPLRMVTVIGLDHASNPPRWLEDSRKRGVVLGKMGQEFEVWWENEFHENSHEDAAYMAWVQENKIHFLASDPAERYPEIVNREDVEVIECWNGRLYDATTSQALQRKPIPEDHINVSEWSGVVQLTTVREARRISWSTEEEALHSVVYREVGDQGWKRQAQPGLYKKAWILLPDIKEGQEYEWFAVSELPDGTVLSSPFIRHRMTTKSSDQ